MFALCTAEEARNVGVDTNVGCNFTKFNCSHTVIHDGTGNVSVFAAHFAFRAVFSA